MCGKNTTINVLALQIADFTCKIYVFRCRYSRNKVGDTFPIPLIFLRLLSILYGSPDNKKISLIAGLDFYRFPESGHAFEICCKAVWL